MKHIFFKTVLLSLSLSVPLLHAQQTRFYIYEKNDQFKAAPWFRYNKAEGLFTGLSAQFLFTEQFFMEGRAGYALAGKFPRYKIGLQKTFVSDNNEFFIRADYYDLTETNDEHVLPDWENSLTSLLFKLDYYNFYRERGPVITFGQNWNGTYKIDLYAGMRDFYALSNKAKFSLFDTGGDRKDGKRVFAYNPRAAEGRDYYLGLSYDIDYRPSPTAFVNAWQFKGRYENSALLHSATHSDFSYQRMELQFQRFQRVFTKQKTVLSLKIASYSGRTQFTSDTLLAPRDQFLYDIGGYGSLRGYSYREFLDGNRMILFNWDYYFNGSFLPKSFLTKIWGIGNIFRAGDLFLFADAGYVWQTDPSNAFYEFSRFDLQDIKADAGLGLAFADWVRFEAAFPLSKGIDTRRSDHVFYLRITPKF